MVGSCHDKSKEETIKAVMEWEPMGGGKTLRQTEKKVLRRSKRRS